MLNLAKILITRKLKKAPCFTGINSSEIVHLFIQIQGYLNHQSEPTATCAASIGSL